MNISNEDMMWTFGFLGIFDLIISGIIFYKYNSYAELFSHIPILVILASLVWVFFIRWLKEVKDKNSSPNNKKDKEEKR